MHSFFAALFALVFSFSHTASLRHSQIADPVVAASAHHRADYTPSHRELVRAAFTSGSYAGSGCVSCRRMNALYRLR